VLWLSIALTVAGVAGITGLRAQESRRRSEEGRPANRPADETGSTNSGSINANSSATGAARSEVGNFQSVARLISDRNIFDPERQPRTPGSAPRPVARPEIKADAPEFGLVGILDYSRGRFAFFDGNASDYRKALQQDATIAGHRIVRITGNSVSLIQGTNAKPVEVRVGTRLRRNNDGAWEAASGGPTPFSPKNSSSKNAGDAPSSGGTSGNAAEDEVLKRLLKKREQEMK
jgi:hypothetical protein